MDRHPTKSRGLAWWQWALLPLMAAVIVMTYCWLGPAWGFQDPQSARIMIWHVPQAMLSVIWFGIAAWYAGRLLWKNGAFDDARSAKASEIGLILTILTVVTGALFSKMQWAGGFNSPWYAGYWQWDPKQTCALIVILIFGAYFGLRMSVEDPRTRARLSAVYALIAFATVPFLYYVVPQILEKSSLHPDAPLFKPGALSPSYRVTYWLSTLGFLGITLWIYHLQLRLAALVERRATPAAGPAPLRLEAQRRARPQNGAGSNGRSEPGHAREGSETSTGPRS